MSFIGNTDVSSICFLIKPSMAIGDCCGLPLNPDSVFAIRGNHYPEHYAGHPLVAFSFPNVFLWMFVKFMLIKSIYLLEFTLYF